MYHRGVYQKPSRSTHIALQFVFVVTVSNFTKKFTRQRLFLQWLQKFSHAHRLIFIVNKQTNAWIYNLSDASTNDTMHFQLIVCYHKNKRTSFFMPLSFWIHSSFDNVMTKLTNKEALTVLCSVVKHAGSGRAQKNCRGKHETLSSVFPYLLSALPLPKCFTTEQSIVKASYLFHDKETNNFPMHLLNFQTKLYFPKEKKWCLQCTVLW